MHAYTGTILCIRSNFKFKLTIITFQMRESATLANTKEVRQDKRRNDTQTPKHPRPYHRLFTTLQRFATCLISLHMRKHC